MKSIGHRQKTLIDTESDGAETQDQHAQRSRWMSIDELAFEGADNGLIIAAECSDAGGAVQALQRAYRFRLNQLLCPLDRIFVTERGEASRGFIGGRRRIALINAVDILQQTTLLRFERFGEIDGGQIRAATPQELQATGDVVTEEAGKDDDCILLEPALERLTIELNRCRIECSACRGEACFTGIGDTRGDPGAIQRNSQQRGTATFACCQQLCERLGFGVGCQRPCFVQQTIGRCIERRDDGDDAPTLPIPAIDLMDRGWQICRAAQHRAAEFQNDRSMFHRHLHVLVKTADLHARRAEKNLPGRADAGFTAALAVFISRPQADDQIGA